jgi:dimeric dUTPase (all-alpha-NTP-PPase superfamily)
MFVENEIFQGGKNVNLTKLFKMQTLLDKHIEQEHPIQAGEDRLSKKILALQVELGELANELPEVFKFWSYKKNDYKKALKEYVDALHFLLSVGLEEYESYHFLLPINHQLTDITSIKEETIVEQFNSIFTEIGILNDSLFQNCYTANCVEDSYGNAFRLFIGLGEMLGFTREEIENAYIVKNAVNHERQEQGY